MPMIEWRGTSWRRAAIGCGGIFGVVELGRGGIFGVVELGHSLLGMLAWTVCVLVALYVEARFR